MRKRGEEDEGCCCQADDILLAFMEIINQGDSKYTQPMGEKNASMHYKVGWVDFFNPDLLTSALDQDINYLLSCLDRYRIFIQIFKIDRSDFIFIL